MSDWISNQNIEYIKYLQNERYLRVIVPDSLTGVKSITAEIRCEGNDYYNYEDGFNDVIEAKKYAEDVLARRLL